MSCARRDEAATWNRSGVCVDCVATSYETCASQALDLGALGKRRPTPGRFFEAIVGETAPKGVEALSSQAVQPGLKDSGAKPRVRWDVGNGAMCQLRPELRIVGSGCIVPKRPTFDPSRAPGRMSDT